MSGMARVQPAKLVRGLADAWNGWACGLSRAPPSPNTQKGRVTTTRGIVRAPIILRATEGFTAGIKGHKRDWLPLNSAQIATPPLPPEVWDKIGWQGHELFHDFYNSYCYCQRTREGRITVGARGVPYLYGSAMDRNGEPDAETIRRLTEMLHRHFPAAIPFASTTPGAASSACRATGARPWGLTPQPALAGRAAMSGSGCPRQTLPARPWPIWRWAATRALTHLPWVNRQVRKWEPEPLRWLGVHPMYQLYGAADFRETVHNTPPSRLAALGNWLTGR